MIPDQTLAEIESAARAATEPGDWSADENIIWSNGRGVPVADVRIGTPVWYKGPALPYEANARFITLACNNAAAMVGEIRALKEERDFIRPEVRAFARLMEEKLRANDHKPGWKHDDPEELINRAEQETNELRQAVCRAFGETHWPLREGDYRPHEFAQHMWRTATKEERAEWSAKIPGEAADVANFAMMVWDVCARATQKGTSDV